MTSKVRDQETPAVEIPDFEPDNVGEYTDLPRTSVSDVAEQNIILWGGDWFELTGEDGVTREVCSVAYSLDGMTEPTATFLAGGVLAKQLQSRNFPMRCLIHGARSKSSNRAYWTFAAPARD